MNLPLQGPYEDVYLSKDTLNEEIESIWKTINKTLKTYKVENELFVFDFTFVLHRNQKVDVNSTFKYIHKEYPVLLEKFLATGQALLETRNSITRSFANIGGTEGVPCETAIEEYSNSFEQAKPVKFSTWHDFLKEHNYGGCSYILFNRLSLTEGEEIELGIYCVLKASLANKSKAVEFLERKLHQFLLTTGQKSALQHYLHQVKQQATRAAISQVMARNMSHNIGSHVLSKYKSKDDFETSEIFGQNQYLAKCLGIESGFDSSNNKLKIAAIQRAYFNEYLKNRMDFLADIATVDHPTSESPLKLKEEILRWFDKNRILLNRISGLDSGISFDVCVKLPGTLKDILVAIPNDVLGCQALYIILENIIRNSTKHSKRDSEVNELNFTITIELCEYVSNKNYYEVQIYDDIPKPLKGKKGIRALVNNRNKLFNSTIIDSSTNRLRDTGLGSIEMDVCAAYLRKQPITDVEDPLFDVVKPFYKSKNGAKLPNLIHAYAQPLRSGEFSLGYKLYLRKPQSLLIFDDKNQLKKRIREIEQLRSKGVTILSTDSKKKYSFRADNEYGHELLIWLNDSDKFSEFYEKHKSILPIRVLKKEDFPQSFQIKQRDTETKEEVWKTYIEKYLKRKEINGYNIVKVKPSIASYPEACQNNEHVYIDNHATSWEQKKAEGIYYEMCCSHHRLNKMNLKANSLHKLQYIEAVACKMVLIDERIQANIVNSNKEYEAHGATLKFKEYFEQMGIYIPKKEDADLNRANFGILDDTCSEDSKEVACKLKRYIQERFENEKIDFCVIHLGVIEKLFAENEDKMQPEISSKIEMLVGNRNLDKVVITSGRGKPDNLAGTFRYMPFAVIQNYVETLFDKFLLVNALYNSRKSK